MYYILHDFISELLRSQFILELNKKVCKKDWQQNMKVIFYDEDCWVKKLNAKVENASRL